MEENMMSISKINFSKEGKDKVSVTFTFSDSSEFVMSVKIEEDIILPATLKDKLVWKALDENLVTVINSLIMNIA